MGRSITPPSKADCPPRNFYSVKHKTLNELNPYLSVSDYVSVDANYKYNTNYALYCTPFRTSKAAWSLWADIPETFRTNGVQTDERDYWADPRFNSNACYELSPASSGTSLSYYIYKDAYGRVCVATLSADGNTYTEQADFGDGPKRLLILLVAGGGGGGGGLVIDKAFNDMTGSNARAYIGTAGGGGGGGATRFVVVDVSTLKRLMVPNPSRIVADSICVHIGSGGEGGSGYENYGTVTVFDGKAAELTRPVRGHEGYDTYITRNVGGKEVMRAGCSGGDGGGAQRSVYKTESGGYTSIGYYNVSSTGGNGSGCYDTKGKGAYYLDVDFLYDNAAPTLQSATISGVSGGAGEEVDKRNDIIGRTNYDGSGLTSSGTARVCGLNVKGFADSYSISTQSGGAKMTRSYVDCTTSQELRFDVVALGGGGGGASAVGAGGGVSNWTYNGKENMLTINYTDPGCGGGGAGGCSMYSPSNMPSEAFGHARDGQKGGDGCALIWYPAAPKEYTTFLYLPQMNGKYSQGEWEVSASNSNSFDTVAKIVVTDESGDEVSYQEVFVEAGDTVTIEKNGSPLDDGDAISVFFTSGMNVSGTVSHTLDSDAEDSWSE